MDKGNVAYKHNDVLFSRKAEQNHVTCGKMGGTKDQNIKQNKVFSERQIS
jgi:hypothetical protein